MADHRFVETVVTWLNDEWDSTNYPGTAYAGEVPSIVDGDDAESQSTDIEGRSLPFPLNVNNVVIVSSSPTRQQRPIGTEFDYQFDDGISIRVAGVHTEEHGHISGSAEFRALYQEARRVVHGHRVWPDRNQSGSQHTDTLYIDDETNLSPQYKDLYEYDMTVLARGYEELP